MTPFRDILKRSLDDDYSGKLSRAWAVVMAISSSRLTERASPLILGFNPSSRRTMAETAGASRRGPSGTMRGSEHSLSRLLDTRRPRGRLMASLTPVQRTARPIPARQRLPKFPYQYPRARSVEASNVQLSHQRLQAAEHRRAPTPSLKRRGSIRDTSERPRRLAGVANAPRGVVPAMRTLRPERASTALV